jgi:TatA/E family protein of Tat protein translocase
MFDIGFPELILIMVVALLVFGPNKMVEIGRDLGKGLRDFRRATTDITKEFNDAIKLDAPAPAPAPTPATPASEPVKMAETPSAAPAVGAAEAVVAAVEAPVAVEADGSMAAEAVGAAVEAPVAVEADGSMAAEGVVAAVEAPVAAEAEGSMAAETIAQESDEAALAADSMTPEEAPTFPDGNPSEPDEPLQAG